MKVKDIINSDLIESDMYVVIRREDSFCTILLVMTIEGEKSCMVSVAEGEQYKDSIIKYYDREVSAFTWQDDGELYINLK